MNMPVLGVGLTYFSGIEPILEENADLIDLIEIEPQTLWLHSPAAAAPYRVDEAALQRIMAFPYPKLVHGIGCPVGGSRVDMAQIPLLASMARVLGAPWASEHLSFNRAADPAGAFNTGFLLPPLQTWGGVRCAVNSIRMLAGQMPVPLAVETGVNYLRPQSNEMSDGEFVAAVTNSADCGILLDLHNLWTNARNGRQTVEDFLSQIPLDRVWEVHLAGGLERHGYWLDSHSGAVPEPLLEMAHQVLPRLPNLRAIVFELFPAYLPVVGLDVVRSQLEQLHRLWEARGVDARTVEIKQPASREVSSPAETTARAQSVSEWEDTLGGLVIGRHVDSELALHLSRDPGIEVLRELIEEFRGSMVVSVLRLTSRLLMLTLGEGEFKQVLRRHWDCSSPELFASSESEGFAAYLEILNLPIAHLPEVLAYERAVISAVIVRENRVVSFSHDPLMILRALAEGRLPTACVAGLYEVEVTPERTTQQGFRPLSPSH